MKKNKQTTNSNPAQPPKQRIRASFINPKAITIEQLYGSYSEQSQEWNNGVLSNIMMEYCAASTGNSGSYRANDNNALGGAEHENNQQLSPGKRSLP